MLPTNLKHTRTNVYGADDYGRGGHGSSRGGQKLVHQKQKLVHTTPSLAHTQENMRKEDRHQTRPLSGA